MPAEELLELPSGRFTLRRRPHREGTSLRAWDAADLMLLDAVAARPAPPARLLLIGDSHGCLATTLAPTPGVSVLDRAASRIATRANLGRNELDDTDLRFTDDLCDPDAGADLVLMKLPRDNDLLELRLRRLVHGAAPGTTVLAGVMARRLSKRAISLFDRLLGGVEISRAVRKARVLTAVVGEAPKAPQMPKTRAFSGPDGLRLVAWPSVFGAARLDVGAPQAG